MIAMAEKNEEYTASSIKILEGLEAVRKRPAMYIGDTYSRGYHHLLYEVLDNSIDEALAGHCTEIRMTLKADGSAEVVDNGRGIPVDIHPDTGKSALEVVTTILHAGGKFDNKNYKVSGGLHGVGISVVNALSEWMTVEVHRNGHVHMQRYERGVPSHDVKVTGTTGIRGTAVRFKPDTKIFGEQAFEPEGILARLREEAFLNPKVKIIFNDEASKKEETFYSERGLADFVEALDKDKPAVSPVLTGSKSEGSVQVDFALQYVNSYSENIYAFANSIKNEEGGTHLVGFRSALTRVINDFIKRLNLLKGEDKITGDDIREGLTAAIHVRLPSPQFEGQTKTKLGNNEIKGIVDSIVYDTLKEWMEMHPEDGKRISHKIISAMEAREAAKKAKELVRRKSVFETSVLPGKLADCATKKAEEAELFIVEGESAGGCFAGDIEVALADGRSLSFKELIDEDKKGKANYCYTINADGTVGIGLIKNPRKTKTNAEVMKITLDNGESVICTLDHRFMLRDGSYTRADSLNNGISLMPLNRKLSKMEGRITIKGYEMVYDPKKSKWIFTHVLADRYNVNNDKYSCLLGAHKHHVDFNKLNNSPENIIRLSKEGHLGLHAKIAEKTLLREDNKQKAREAHKNPEYRENISKIMSTPEMRKMLSERAKKQWDSQEYKEYMVKKFINFYENNAEYREETIKRLDKAQKDYWSKEENRKLQSGIVMKYFEEHPEARHILSELSKKQWDNPQLKKWRSNKTKEQWTSEFRKNRKQAYDRTYFNATIGFMKQILEKYGNLESYDKERAKSGNRNLLKKGTFVERFFDDDEGAMLEAVKNFNHKIAIIERLDEKMDVYDLEVEGTHNFALAAGIFVHNSAKQGRDREFQAILPLKGKILNIEKATLQKLLNNAEIKNIILALGTGFSDEFDVKKLRYHKIITMTDADVDGSHIMTLLLTLFFRYFRPLIEGGYIYVAMPPLYKLKKGRVEKYAYSDEEKDRLLKELGEGTDVQRYKGLGEMNPDQLWGTTMDPATRKLKKISIQDAAYADTLFNILMGEEVEPRRKYIEEHALEVKELDV
jgi:DNA gyrase subunit B